jgi:hypothetical protein
VINGYNGFLFFYAQELGNLNSLTYLANSKLALTVLLTKRKCQPYRSNSSRFKTKAIEIQAVVSFGLIDFKELDTLVKPIAGSSKVYNATANWFRLDPTCIGM